MSDDPYDDDTMVMPEDYVTPGTPDVDMAPETITPEGRRDPDPNYQDKQSEVDLATAPFLDEVNSDTAHLPRSPWEDVDLEPNSIFSPGNVDP